MKKEAEQKEYKVPNDKELFEIRLEEKWFYANDKANKEEREKFDTQLRYNGISIKTKLIMWFADSLHPKRKYPCTYQSQSIAATLGTTYNTMKPHLKELTKQGLFHHCEKDGFKPTEWKLGTTDDCPNCQEIRNKRESKRENKKQLELSLVDKTVKDGFAEVSPELYKEFNNLFKQKKYDELFTNVMSYIGNSKSIEELGFVEKYRSILDAFGISSRSAQDEWLQCKSRLEKYGIDSNAFSKKITAMAIVRYICGHIIPKIKNNRILNNECYATNLIETYVELNDKKNKIIN